MSQKLYDENSIQDIANAIRSQNGTHDVYTVAQMGNAVRAIHAQPNLETLNATENGNYLPSVGKDGFSSVSVNVSGSEAVVQPLSVNENGTYSPPSGVDGFAPVLVNVESSSEAVVQPLSITQNGTYNPPSGVDGYAPVLVNVESGGGETIIPIVTAESTFYKSPKQPIGAFGDVAGNFWGAEGRSAWLNIRLQTPCILSKILLSNYYRASSSTYWHSSSITVRASNDGFSTYTDLYIGTELAQSETQFEIDLNNSTPYLEYRFLISDSVAYVGLGRIDLVPVSQEQEKTVKIKVGPTFEHIFEIPVTSEYGPMLNGGATQFLTPVKDDGTEAKLDLSLPFEICCTFMLTRAPSENTGRNVFGAIGYYWDCPAIAVYNTRIAYFFTTQYSKWTHNAITITPDGYSTPLNTWIVAKIIYDNAKYTFSIDDGTVQASQELTGVTTYYNSTYRFCFGSQSSSATYAIAQSGAKIKIEGTYLKQNGALIWGEEAT